MLATALEAPLVSAEARLMGGRVAVHIRAADAADGRAVASRDAESALARLGAWASCLTRFSAGSDLSRLNADARPAVPVRPTLNAVLDWGRAAEAATDGIVDIALLDARLAAEDDLGSPGPGTPELAAPDGASRAWSLDRRSRGAVVRRPPGLRFDLDGVAKGWLADRVLDLLAGHPAALVDADGDIAMSLMAGQRWAIGVDDGRPAADPDGPRPPLATLELQGAEGAATTRYGLATSGTSIHRWVQAGRLRHHLIDPRTGAPATTDVIQATVLAGTARAAEAFAKAAVIVGSEDALLLLHRRSVLGALLLTERGELLATPGTLRWLA
ncbi:MAG: FAD:protein FMN transferase [Candidatus Limnocylindrales bacterium]